MRYKSDIRKVDRTTESPGFPEVILIDNFSGCNLRCSICDHKNIKKYRRIMKMDLSLYKKIIDEIACSNPNARVWEIFFGDPFLCNDMPQRIKYAKDQGLKDVVLNTNGALMSAEKSKALIDAGLDAMYVGIDAIKEETYNKIRVGGNYQKVVKNILTYRDLLLKHSNKNQKLFVQFVVTEFNEEEVDSFKNYWSSERVGVKIRPKVTWGGLTTADNLLPNEAVIRKPCYWIMRTINICADGNVTYCTCDIHCQIKTGNIVFQTIKEVWSGKLKEYRDLHAQNKFGELPEMCKNCSDWQSAYADFY
jgi:radical SAM protein with 4Fe4S-binding SPASM domain